MFSRESFPQGEPQPIHGLFPISEISIAWVKADTLERREISSDDLTTMSRENGDLLNYVVTTSEHFDLQTKEHSLGSFYLLGVVECYTALRAEAELRGGVIPRISSGIIEDYMDYDLGPKETESLPESQQEDLAIEWKQRREQRYKKLLAQEPALKKTFVYRYRGLTSNMYTSLVNGIMDVYGIFYMNAEFQEAHLRQSVADPIEEFIRKEKDAIEQIALLYPLPEESFIPSMGGNEFEELSRIRLIANEDPSATAVVVWLASSGLIIEREYRDYALSYISHIIALKAIKKLRDEEGYTREELDHMQQDTITSFFVTERLLELKGTLSREEMMKVRESVEKAHKKD